MSDLNLRIDAVKIRKELVNFIRQIVKDREMNGILVPFTGFIDSTVVTSLAIEAVGEKNVNLLIRKQRLEKFQKEAKELSLTHLRIPKANILDLEINKIISRLFESDQPLKVLPYLTLNYNLGYYLARSLIKQEKMEGSYLSEDLIVKPVSKKQRYFQEIIAHRKFRMRLQLAYSFLYAESRNLLVVGPVNKTEWSVGLFTKFGPWHLADLMPLRGLYRTEILQLAENLGIPKKIREHDEYDIYSGLQNKYKNLFKLQVTDIDRILVRLENDLTVDEISDELSLTVDLVKKVKHFYQFSAHQRYVPLSLEL